MKSAYYVTVIRDKKIGYLAGPYQNHQDAIDLVSVVREIATEIDPWCAFDTFGTVKQAPCNNGSFFTGVLNALISTNGIKL